MTAFYWDSVSQQELGIPPRREFNMYENNIAIIKL